MSAASITGQVRPGSEFKFTNNPTFAASSTFIALVGTQMIVTRHATTLFGLPDDTPVLAHWHGQWRTDGFAMTIGELKVKAEEYNRETYSRLGEKK